MKKINQNNYGELQLCIRCQQPLEKARVGSRKGRGVCQVCQKKKAKEYRERLIKKKKGLQIIN